MRLFLAINLPDELRKDIYQIGQMFDDFGKMKAVEEENIHLTLKFLGEAEPNQVIGALDGIAFKPFDISLKGIGAFPTKDYVKVLWAGVEKGFDEIVSLNETIENALFHSMKQYEKDQKFHPHATIGRVKFVREKKRLLEFIDESKTKEFGEFKAESFDLMKSELLIGGPEYEVVKSFSH